jgi:hypothetical protein
MSLINEALKKAQRQRNEEAELAAPMPGGGGRSAQRSHGLSTQSLVLLATVGIALFVVCVVMSVIWINRPSPSQTLPVKPLASVKSTAGFSGTALAPIVVPIADSPRLAEPVAAAITAPVTAPSSVIKSAPVQTAPAAPTAPTMSSARSAPVSDLATSTRVDSSPAAPRELAPSFARATDPIAPALPSPIGKFDERIQSLVERFRVAGIRASGLDSKVLLNEKVYKINDIVDRTNGLRLTQVANDSLTFTTPDGITYVKNF